MKLSELLEEVIPLLSELQAALSLADELREELYDLQGQVRDLRFQLNGAEKIWAQHSNYHEAFKFKGYRGLVRPL